MPNLTDTAPQTVPKTKPQAAAAPAAGVKAVIIGGAKQYLVKVGDELEVERLTEKGPLQFEALLLIDGEITKIGQPTVSGASVAAEIVEAEVKADKVTAIRFKAKKRVHKRRGHRQLHSLIRITQISS